MFLMQFANAAEAFSLNYLGLGGLLYILGALLCKSFSLPIFEISTYL